MLGSYGNWSMSNLLLSDADLRCGRFGHTVSQTCARALRPRLYSLDSWQTERLRLLLLASGPGVLGRQRAYSLGLAFVQGQRILAWPCPLPPEDTCIVAERVCWGQCGKQTTHQPPAGHCVITWKERWVPNWGSRRVMAPSGPKSSGDTLLLMLSF